MNGMLTAALIVFIGRIIWDMLFNIKIEMFNRGNLKGIIGFNFIESIVAIYIIKIVIDLVNQNILLLVFLGAGSSIGGLVVLFIRRKINLKLIGERKYFVRISYTGNDDLVDVLKNAGYELAVRSMEYLDGTKRMVLEGSLANRARKEELKSYLKGRPDKHVTIIAAREVYWIG